LTSRAAVPYTGGAHSPVLLLAVVSTWTN